MTKNQHDPNEIERALNQNNRMSEDPKDGSRNSDTLGKTGDTPVERLPANDEQDQSTIEAFGEEGAGVAAKE